MTEQNAPGDFIFINYRIEKLIIYIHIECKKSSRLICSHVYLGFSRGVRIINHSRAIQVVVKQRVSYWTQ